MTEAIVKTVEVNCDASTAFDVFVRRIGSWWPLAEKSASAASGQAALNVTIEPRVGGAVYETMFDGGRNTWGTVLEFQKGQSFAMTWHPGSNADFETRVSVVFESTPGGKCLVTLTHAGWEVWAEKAEEMRENYAGGWAGLLEKIYVGACDAAIA